MHTSGCSSVTLFSFILILSYTLHATSLDILVAFQFCANCSSIFGVGNKYQIRLETMLFDVYIGIMGTADPQDSECSK